MVKLAHRARNWKEYNRNLINRGNLTIWFSEDAVKNLQETITTAKKSGYLGYQLEAPLALGEVLLKSGKRSAGLTQLSEVRSVAQAKGFGLIAKKAR